MISSERLKVACERAEMRAKCNGISDKPGDFGIRTSEWGPLLRELEWRRAEAQADLARGITIGIFTTAGTALIVLTCWGFS